MGQNEQSRWLQRLSISSCILFAINLWVDYRIHSIFDFSRIALIVSFLIPLILTMSYLAKRRPLFLKWSLISFSTFLLLNTIFASQLITKEIDYFRFQKIKEQMKTCESAQDQFQTDLKSNDLKFFTFGMGKNSEAHENLREKYGLEVHHLGCMVIGGYNCYNEKIKEALNIVDPD